jgi:hypothetical protein
MKKLILIAALSVLLAGCAKNPFAARESDDPITPAGTFVPPTSPQIVLENLKLAYSELVIGNLMQTIDSNFVFRFDYIAGVIADTTWGFTAEVNLTENLFNDILLSEGARVLSVELEPRSGQDDIVLDTAATLIRGYMVSISDSLGNDLERYEGVAEFELIESSFNYWTLLVWDDYHLETDSKSWADLKSSYR